jgi:hypothetical protein
MAKMSRNERQRKRLPRKPTCRPGIISLGRVSSWPPSVVYGKEHNHEHHQISNRAIGPDSEPGAKHARFALTVFEPHVGGQVTDA